MQMQMSEVDSPANLMPHLLKSIPRQGEMGP